MNDSDLIRHLPILILCPHNRCNCRCVMCDIWKLESVEEIALSDLRRHAADIEALGVRWVVFSGGEPLMHSDLFRLSDDLRERGIQTTLLSTGLLLGKHAARIIRSIDDVIVSLDGPPQTHDRIRRIRGAFALLSAGVRTVHALKSDFAIAARTTVQRANHRLLRETVKTAMELNMRWISFLSADLTSTAFNRPNGWPLARQSQIGLTEVEANALEEEIEALIAELPRHPGFVRETPEKLRRIVHQSRAHLGLQEPEAPRCNAPWVSAVVESDGTVRPCFFHKPIGNIKQMSLREVLNNDHALEFRRNLNVSLDPVCRRCVCSLYLPPHDTAG